MRAASRAASLLLLAGCLSGCSWFGGGGESEAPATAAGAAQTAPHYEAAPVPPRELMEQQPR